VRKRKRRERGVSRDLTGRPSTSLGRQMGGGKKKKWENLNGGALRNGESSSVRNEWRDDTQRREPERTSDQPTGEQWVLITGKEGERTMGNLHLGKNTLNLGAGAQRRCRKRRIYAKSKRGEKKGKKHGTSRLGSGLVIRHLYAGNKPCSRGEKMGEKRHREKSRSLKR